VASAASASKIRVPVSRATHPRSTRVAAMLLVGSADASAARATSTMRRSSMPSSALSAALWAAGSRSVRMNDER
jgi:hypothetical protein